MNGKKLVALITNHDDDVYCFRKELVEEIVRSGYDILISCPYGEKIELMKELSFIYDDVYIDRRGTNPFSDLKLLDHYRRLFKRYKPDVILTYTAKPNTYASMAAAKLHIPYINNVTGLGSVLGMNRFMQLFVLKLFKEAFKKSSCIFFQNEDNMKLAIRHGLVKGTHKLIPGSGVNTDRYPLQEYPEGGNGIEGEPVIFNYIGRVLHDKGIDDYIEAAEIIKGKYPKTEFNVIGFIEPTENHYEHDLQQLSEKGTVIYRGQQNDVKPWVGRAHAIIHPSTYGEGMSNVLLENASSGRPIITTDNPGCKETIDDGVSGFIYHGGDVGALTRKIEIFLSEMNNADRKQMGLHGRSKVEKEFNREIVVKAYLSKITELCKG